MEIIFADRKREISYWFEETVKKILRIPDEVRQDPMKALRHIVTYSVLEVNTKYNISKKGKVYNKVNGEILLLDEMNLSDVKRVATDSLAGKYSSFNDTEYKILRRTNDVAIEIDGKIYRAIVGGLSVPENLTLDVVVLAVGTGLPSFRILDLAVCPKKKNMPNEMLKKGKYLNEIFACEFK